MPNAKVTEIRSLGLTKVNRLVRAARHLDDLRPAFAEWINGEIYICKKTGTYRYRFGANSKSVTNWSKCAQELFENPAAFALAATVLGAESALKCSDAEAPRAKKADTGRANIIKLASVA
jgi:hypothetical protein